MIELAKLTGLLDDGNLRLVVEHCDYKVLAFQRSGLIFIFNFHPDKSYTNYAVEAFAREYYLVLDTDSASFGGHGRVTPNQTYVAKLDRGERVLVKVYLPSRSALILREEK